MADDYSVSIAVPPLLTLFFIEVLMLLAFLFSQTNLFCLLLTFFSEYILFSHLSFFWWLILGSVRIRFICEWRKNLKQSGLNEVESALVHESESGGSSDLEEAPCLSFLHRCAHHSSGCLMGQDGCPSSSLQDYIPASRKEEKGRRRMAHSFPFRLFFGSCAHHFHLYFISQLFVTKETMKWNLFQALVCLANSQGFHWHRLDLPDFLSAWHAQKMIAFARCKEKKRRSPHGRGLWVLGTSTSTVCGRWTEQEALLSEGRSEMESTCSLFDSVSLGNCVFHSCFIKSWHGDVSGILLWFQKII